MAGSDFPLADSASPCAGFGVRVHMKPAAPSAAMMKAVATAGITDARRFRAPARGAPSTVVVCEVDAAQVSSRARSLASCHRLVGSLASAVRTMRSTGAGVFGSIAAIDGGSSLRIAAISPAWLPFTNARWPVTIS